MSDLERWLSARGLGSLAVTFAAHDIDLGVLLTLTDADLRELGLSLGMRRRVLQATGQAERPADAAAPPAPSAEAAAEHRQLTIMFCDLVDSTRLAMRLDPEELGSVLRAYRACCAAAIERYGGQVAQYLGDGVLAYFCYPTAHEDDAERAIRAALTIQRDMPRLAMGDTPPLHVRIGIATGMVVVGDLFGTGAGADQMVIGQTPNLAARLQGEAPEDGIVISARTHRLAGGLFRCTDLGECSLKGFDAPVRAWRVDGEGRAESRFDSLHGPDMAPLVGRRQELDLLRDLWRRACAGEGQTLLISGEAGVGKSRLVRALLSEVRTHNHFGMSFYCSPYHRTTALHPVIANFEHAAGIQESEPAAARLAKLESLLGQWAAPASQTLPLFGRLLSLPPLGRFEPPAGTPAEVLERTLLAMLARMEELASERPLFCVLEDIHWIDPTTEELLRRTIRRAASLPVLLTVTARPDYDLAALGGPEQGVRLSLGRLGPAEAAAMIGQRAGGRPMPAAVVDSIVEKADGVPLFIEELTKNVLDAAPRAGADPAAPPTRLDVPDTLYDSLMARLDQMSAVKQVAQLAAVVGRSFSIDLLAAASALPQAALHDAVRQLVAAELFYRIDRPGPETFEFKHALLQDVAYQSLVRPVRRRFHAQVAEALERHFPATATAQPELLAHHCGEAGQTAQAIGHWLAAGRRAAQRSGNLEAIEQLRRGIALLEGLEDPADRLRREQQLRLAMISPLVAARGYTAPEVGENCDRLVELSAQTGDTSGIFPVLESRNSFESVMGELDLALRHAQEAMRLAERHPAGAGTISATRVIGSTTLLHGDPAAALPLLERAVALYDPAQHGASAFEYGQDLFVVSAAYLCLAQWQLGRLGEAAAWERRTMDRARSLAHLNTLCLGLAFTGGFFRGLARDVQGLDPAATELLALATEHKLPIWLAAGAVMVGHAKAEQGHLAEGLAQMQDGVAKLDAIRVRLFAPIFRSWLAAAQLRAGEIEAGLATVDATLAITARGERWLDAELHRLRGALLLAAGDGRAAAGEASLVEAHAIATAQGARTLRLRSAVSLAGLYRGRGERDAARRLLGLALDGVAEAPQDRDGAAARSLLATLD